MRKVSWVLEFSMKGGIEVVHNSDSQMDRETLRTKIDTNTTGRNDNKSSIIVEETCPLVSVFESSGLRVSKL
jgi:hypothetical protein